MIVFVGLTLKNEHVQQPKKKKKKKNFKRRKGVRNKTKERNTRSWELLGIFFSIFCQFAIISLRTVLHALQVYNCYTILRHIEIYILELYNSYVLIIFLAFFFLQ
jgi:hypothetical protein